MKKTVVIDCFPESARKYNDGYAVVAIDVIRATTTAITAVVTGRRCFPVPTLESALARAARLERPLLVGELGGNKPFGFHLNNSPVEIVQVAERDRPIVLLSTSGTQLIYEARLSDAPFLACFRNAIPTADYLARHYSRVAVIGAGTRGEFREEDQICCAWIAERLMKKGFQADNRQTVDLVSRWKGASPQACYVSKSVGYLMKSNQVRDLKFILSNVNDVNSAFMMLNEEVIEIPVTPADNSLKPERRTEEQYSRVTHR